MCYKWHLVQNLSMQRLFRACDFKDQRFIFSLHLIFDEDCALHAGWPQTWKTWKTWKTQGI